MKEVKVYPIQPLWNRNSYCPRELQIHINRLRFLHTQLVCQLSARIFLRLFFLLIVVISVAGWKQSLASQKDKCIQTTSYFNPDLSAEGLHKDFSQLLPTGLNHDLELKCGGESAKVHKIVLCARSDVFKAMLESNMQERRTGVVEITDVDARYFQDFVRYLYTDTMPELTLEEAMVLYAAGDKYDIRSLMLRCSEYLRDNLSRENAFKCFELADAHSDQKLKDSIKAYIMDEKIYLDDDEYWSPFCESYPKEAVEVYRLSYKRISEETNSSNLKKLKNH